MPSLCSVRGDAEHGHSNSLTFDQLSSRVIPPFTYKLIACAMKQSLDCWYVVPLARHCRRGIKYCSVSTVRLGKLLDGSTLFSHWNGCLTYFCMLPQWCVFWSRREPSQNLTNPLLARTSKMQITGDRPRSCESVYPLGSLVPAESQLMDEKPKLSLRHSRSALPLYLQANHAAQIYVISKHTL